VPLEHLEHAVAARFDDAVADESCGAPREELAEIYRGGVHGWTGRE
jgi:hypothetical protein